MKDLEKDASIATCYKELQTALVNLYEKREAGIICTYIFEDAFGLLNAHQMQEKFDVKNRKKFTTISQELLAHRPWQYVVGQADFYGLKFFVDERVLIPRPETEELVQVMINQHKKQPIDLLDVGTGSACIAISLQKGLPDARITGVDVSKEALEIAQKNVDLNKSSVQLQVLDILDVNACKKMPNYHVIVSNPPYIQEEEVTLMPQQVVEHEPHLALFVTNNDPLQFYKTIADFALEHLYSKGCLYFEINEFFGPQVLEMLQKKGFQHVQLIQDIFGKDRIVSAQLS